MEAMDDSVHHTTAQEGHTLLDHPLRVERNRHVDYATAIGRQVAQHYSRVDLSPHVLFYFGKEENRAQAPCRNAHPGHTNCPGLWLRLA
jgi:hypothetical protein